MEKYFLSLFSQWKIFNKRKCYYLLLFIKQKTAILVERTKSNPQETLANKMKKPTETLSFRKFL